MPGKPYMTGMAIGLKQAGVEFDVLAEHSGCFLCGEVYQSPQDRAYYQLLEQGASEKELAQLHAVADKLRDEWRTKHSATHTNQEHEKLAQSEDIMTVEAVENLAPLGTFPLAGSKEVMHALEVAPRLPTRLPERG